MHSRGSKLSAGRKTSIARTLQGTLDQNLPGEYRLLDDISAKAPRRRIIKEITSTRELDMQSLLDKGRFIKLDRRGNMKKHH